MKDSLGNAWHLQGSHGSLAVAAEVSCDKEAGSRPCSITDAKVYARKASLAKVSHSFSLPHEVDDLLSKLIVRGVDRQGCRLVIVSGEAQKSRTF
jgi:hypothetical protein